MGDKTELKPCEHCGEHCVLEMPFGTCLEISCCVSMSIQKSDYLTTEEKATWNSDVEAQYSKEAEAKVRAVLIKKWNTRQQSPLEKFTKLCEEHHIAFNVYSDGDVSSVNSCYLVAPLYPEPYLKLGSQAALDWLQGIIKREGLKGGE